MNKKSLLLILALLLLVSLPLASCSSATPIAPTASYSPSTGYPEPELPASSYPSPQEQRNLFPKNILPSTNNVGVIRGKLIMPIDATPGVFPGIYLGLILRDNNGNAIVTSLDRTTASKAQIDSQGYFVFQDVEIGNYTLLIDLVDSMMILQENNGEGKLLEIKGGEVIDVGEIIIE